MHWQRLMEQIRKAHIILVRKYEGKRLVGKPWHEGVDNITMEQTEIRHQDVNQVQLVRDMPLWRALLTR
jgi:hypothetical protein